MLTFLEYTHFDKFPIGSCHLPFWYYKQNPKRIDWSRACFHLPLDFQAKYPPDDPENYMMIRGVLIPPGYSGSLTQKEFEEVMNQPDRRYIFANQNIPTEWFEPYFSSFEEREWVKYLDHRALTEEQFDLYGWQTWFYNRNAPLSRIPYQAENFKIIFSHPQITIEFIQAHLEDAMTNLVHLLSTKSGYSFALEHLDPSLYSDNKLVRPEDLDKRPRAITSKTFTRFDLPMWFTDKHRDLIGGIFNSRPSKTLAAWLRRYRPRTQSSWRYKDPNSPSFRLTFKGYSSASFPESAQEEKAFVSSVKKAISLFF